MFGLNKKKDKKALENSFLEIDDWEKSFLKIKNPSKISLAMNNFIEKIDMFLYPYRYCHFCKKKTDLLNHFKCHYCNEYFCPNHSLPENHRCKGHPKALEGGFREIHEASGRVRAGG